MPLLYNSLEKIKYLQELYSKKTNNKDLNLPNVIIIGSKASGKTSIISHIIGDDLFPIGSDTFTKCPVVIKFVSSEIYLIKVGAKNFQDALGAKNEIIRLMNAIGNNISCNPINVEVHSSKLNNFTLVDLPGLIKIQIMKSPTMTPNFIENLVRKYIEQPNTIILCVIEATTDICNSYALKLAKQFDKNGERTLGVLTKLDLINSDSSLLDTLNNKAIYLKNGYVGLINKKINSNTAYGKMADILFYEIAFICENLDFDKAFDRIGVSSFLEVLYRLLLNIAEEKIKDTNS